MTGSSRRGLFTRSLIALALVAGSTLVAGAAAAADLSEEGAESFADIAACAARTDHLLAAIMVDSSGSLKETDPSDQRVGAILSAIDSLEQLATGSGEALDVQANLATFGEFYEPLVGWGAVEASHSQALKASAQSDLPTRDSDRYTDYRALRGAQQSLNARAAAIDGTSCKVILWFTDGRLDVGDQTEAVRAELCGRQGVVDSVRGDNIAILALALFTESGGGSVSDQDRDRLRAIAEGTAGGESCGTVPIPASSASGSYLRADDAGAIRRLFAQAAAMIEGATPGTSVSCPNDDVCPKGRLIIPVDAGVGAIRLILEREPSAPLPMLIAPDGTSSKLSPELSQVGGAGMLVSDRDGLMTVNVALSDGNTGTWTLVSDPASTTLVDLYYFWNVALAITAPDSLIVGETNTVAIELRDHDGDLTDVDDLASVEFDVTVDGAAAQATVADTGGWEVQIDIPSTEVPPAVRIEATARAISAPNKIALGPIAAQQSFETSFPPSFPTVSELTMSPILAGELSTGTLAFAGSDRGDTRACLGPASVESPKGAGLVVFSSADTCVDVPANGQATLDVSVKAQNPADGRVDGLLPITLTGVDADEVTLSVPFGMSMSRPVNEPVLWGLIVLFSALALALAWATAEVARRVSDRYVLSTDARVASVSVVARPDGVRRIDNPDGPLLDPATDFVPVGMDRKRRVTRFTAGGLVFQRAFSLNPLASAQPWAADSTGAIVVSPGGNKLTLRPDGSRAPVRFPGSVGFVFVAEPVASDAAVDSDVRGRLVVVVDSPDGVAAVLEDRFDEINAEGWDRIVEAVVAANALRSAPKSGKTAEPPAAAAAETVPGDTTEPAAPSMPRGLDWHDEPSPAMLQSDPKAKPVRKRQRKSPPAESVRSEEEVLPDETPPPRPPTSVNFWD